MLQIEDVLLISGQLPGSTGINHPPTEEYQGEKGAKWNSVLLLILRLKAILINDNILIWKVLTKDRWHAYLLRNGHKT